MSNFISTYTHAHTQTASGAWDLRFSLPGRPFCCRSHFLLLGSPVNFTSLFMGLLQFYTLKSYNRFFWMSLVRFLVFRHLFLHQQWNVIWPKKRARCQQCNRLKNCRKTYKITYKCVGEMAIKTFFYVQINKRWFDL